MEQEQIEQEAREFLANLFVRTKEVHEQDEPVEEGGGTYVWFQFDTLRNPQGEGEFKVTVTKVEDHWVVADYQALPNGGHRG